MNDHAVMWSQALAIQRKEAEKIVCQRREQGERELKDAQREADAIRARAQQQADRKLESVAEVGLLVLKGTKRGF